MDFGAAEEPNGVRPIQSPDGDRPNKIEVRLGGSSPPTRPPLGYLDKNDGGEIRVLVSSEQAVT